MTLRLLLKISLFGLCVLTGSLFAAGDPVMTLNTRLSEIQSLQADFVQTITDSHGRQISHATGSLSLIRPGKFRWQVNPPEGELVIANDKKLLVYDPDLQQLVIRTLSDNDSEVPALLLSRGDISSGDHFVVRLQSENPEIFHLTPKNKDSLFSDFQLMFDKNNLVKMTFVDHLKQTTVIAFKHQKHNPALPAKLFDFKAPRGTDVIYDNAS